MSHNIRLSGIVFKDVKSLAQIVKDVSNGAAVLDMGAKTFRTYMGQDSSSDGTIKLPGRYDIGLKREANGHVPIMESALLHQAGPLGPVGAPLGFVQQEYALREAEYEAAQKGMTTTRVAGPNGRITLEMVLAD